MYVIMIKGGSILTTALIIAIMLLTQGKHSLDKLVMLTIFSFYKNFCEHRHGKISENQIFHFGECFN